MLLISQPSFAQIVDRSIAVGFVAEPQVVRAMDDGKWLVVGRGLPYRGALYADTIFAVIFNQQGEVSLRKGWSCQAPSYIMCMTPGRWPMGPLWCLLVGHSAM